MFHVSGMDSRFAGMARRSIPLLAFLLMMGLLSAAGCRAGLGANRPGEFPPAADSLPAPSPVAAPTRSLPPPVVAAGVGMPVTILSETEEVAGRAAYSFAPVIMRRYADLGCNEERGGEAATVTGEMKQWYPLTLAVRGPIADEADESPNPFLDYRLQVRFLGPGGQAYDVPGYFAGDGRGNGAGDVWQVRFSPDEAGAWRYCVSFRAGESVAVDADMLAGAPLPFDGRTGEFMVTDRDPEAPGFLKWGRLEYTGQHYLKFRDGPYWIKGGTDSPENFLGYAGFDNTIDQGGIIPNFLHTYAPHVGDWREGDPDFAGPNGDMDGRGIIGALNYLSEQHVNSIYFLPMNLGGDGQDSYPFLSPDGSPGANTHYDVGKLAQWDTVLQHAQRMGIALHVVLNETEQANRRWLDGGALGVERKLFYREMVARFGYLLALKWNLSEENVFSAAEIGEFADTIRAYDWAGHPIAVHNPFDSFGQYQQLLGDSRFPTTAIHYRIDEAGQIVERWRELSRSAGRPWVVDMDENNPAGVGLGPDNAGELRKTVLYDVYFSGGNIEWYAGYYDLPPGGDVNLEDFRTREAMWRTMWYARRFMEDNLPFWAMEPADALLSGESEAFGGGEVFAYHDEIFAVYLPAANPSGVLQAAAGREYRLRWYDPRTGEFAGEAVSVVASAEGLPLGAPPHSPDGDWVVLVEGIPKIEATPLPVAYP